MGQRASYTPVGGPVSTATATAYGKSGGRAAAQGGPVPSVESNGSVVGVLPAMPGTFRVGENKNVSTPVSG